MCRQMVHGWPLWNLDDIWNNNIINCEASQAALGPLVELLPSLPELCKYNNEVILYSTETQLCWAITVGDGGGAIEIVKYFSLLRKRHQPLKYLSTYPLKHCLAFHYLSLFTPMEMLRGEIVKGQLGGCCHPSLPFLYPLWPQAKNTNSNKIEIKWKHHQQATIINRTTESSFSWKVPGHYI